MQRHPLQKTASKPKGAKPTNLDHLIQYIRTKLGPDWVFYKEFLDAAMQATAHGQDVTAWLGQVEQLIEGRQDVALSHQGVLFLLTERGVKSRGEALSNANMLPPPLPQPTGINSHPALLLPPSYTTTASRQNAAVSATPEPAAHYQRRPVPAPAAPPLRIQPLPPTPTLSFDFPPTTAAATQNTHDPSLRRNKHPQSKTYAPSGAQKRRKSDFLYQSWLQARRGRVLRWGGTEQRRRRYGQTCC